MLVEPQWRNRIETIDSAVDEIHLPDGTGDIDQDQEWCEAVVDGDRHRFRFHDYDRIYEVPGLYERLFYGELECCSPSRVARMLEEMLSELGEDFESMRVLDLGAGNGMVGDELRARGASFLVGADIITEAREATHRDRPGLYDDYQVVDMTDLNDDETRCLQDHDLNCLTSVAALGYGDIPPQAFIQALDLIETPGWVAFTIKEDFLYEDDSTGFCRLIRTLSRERILQTQAYRRYRHRISISGDPLYYVAMIARKQHDIPPELLEGRFEMAALRPDSV